MLGGFQRHVRVGQGAGGALIVLGYPLSFTDSSKLSRSKVFPGLGFLLVFVCFLSMSNINPVKFHYLVILEHIM